MALRRMSDRLCIENGLSIIQNPGRKGKHYGAWLGENKPVSFQQKIRTAIDAALEQGPADFQAFLRLMEAAGYTVGGGKHITFMGASQKKPTRCDTLKGDHTETAIRERIAGTRIVKPTGAPVTAPAVPKLLIDVENSIKAKGSPGYERWAKIFNLKQAASTLIMLQENDLTEYGQLRERAEQAAARYNEIGGQLKGIEGRLAEIAALQKQIGIYGKTRDVYAAYRKAGYNKKFLAEHEREITQHKEAKKAFDALGLTKLPSIKALQTEYAQLHVQKKKLYAEYNAARQEMKTLITAKTNVDRLLRYAGQEPEQAKPPQK
jgi:chaperonin cofactor prefoldin